MKHDLIKTGDNDVFSAILDRNGEVVLSYCRRCKKGEGELEKECPTGECPVCGCHTWGDFDSENHDELAHRVNQDYVG